MTSNLGTQEFNRQHLGFEAASSDGKPERVRLRASVEDALKKAFRPELLNRIDEVIIFDALTKE